MDPATARRHEGCDPGAKVVIEIEDNGCGMEEEVASRCLEPFYTTREVGQGSGLGLAQVYGIVQQNFACMKIDTQPGRGTVFRIYWPRCQEAGREDPDQVPAGGEMMFRNFGQGRTLLLVEDDEKILRLAEKQLSRVGFRVISANNGESALERWAGHLKLGERIDIVFTDIVMPGFSGVELGRRLREQAPEVKIIYTTGYSDERVIGCGLAANEAFLPKPYTMKDLFEAIKQLYGS